MELEQTVTCKFCGDEISSSQTIIHLEDNHPEQSSLIQRLRSMYNDYLVIDGERIF